jgi:hypothetical protein
MKKAVILVIIGFLFPLTIKAQTNSVEKDLIKEYKEILVKKGGENKIDFAKEGTFLLIFSSENSNPIEVNNVLLAIIESKRDENKSVTYVLNPEVKILIPSRKHISNPDYIPFKTDFIIEK